MKKSPDLCMANILKPSQCEWLTPIQPHLDLNKMEAYIERDGILQPITLEQISVSDNGNPVYVVKSDVIDSSDIPSGEIDYYALSFENDRSSIIEIKPFGDHPTTPEGSVLSKEIALDDTDICRQENGGELISIETTDAVNMNDVISDTKGPAIMMEAVGLSQTSDNMHDIETGKNEKSDGTAENISVVHSGLPNEDIDLPIPKSCNADMTKLKDLLAPVDNDQHTSCTETVSGGAGCNVSNLESLLTPMIPDNIKRDTDCGKFDTVISELREDGDDGIKKDGNIIKRTRHKRKSALGAEQFLKEFALAQRRRMVRKSGTTEVNLDHSGKGQEDVEKDNGKKRTYCKNKGELSSAAERLIVDSPSSQRYCLRKTKATTYRFGKNLVCTRKRRLNRFDKIYTLAHQFICCRCHRVFLSYHDFMDHVEKNDSENEFSRENVNTHGDEMPPDCVHKGDNLNNDKCEAADVNFLCAVCG